MSLVNQMLQELDRRGQADPVLATAVPYGVNASAPDPAPPLAARSRRVVFAVSALAAAIAAAWYLPSQPAAPGDTPATQQQLASRQAPQVATVAVASSPLHAPVVAPVTPPAKLAEAPDRAAANKAAESATGNGGGSQQVSARTESPRPAKAQPADKASTAAAERTRSSQPDEAGKTSPAAAPAATHPAPKGVTASTVATAPHSASLAQSAPATAQLHAQPAQPSSPPALATAVAPDTAKAAATDVSVHAAPPQAAARTTAPERAAPTNNNAVSGGVHLQTRQSPPLDSADAAYREGLARFNAGDSAQAVRSFRAALAENPKHRRATEALAAVHVERREWDAALATLRDALAIDPKQPSLAMLAARLLARDGNRDAAVQTLKAALDDTSPADAHAALAALLGELKRDREAIPFWLAALKKLPDRAVWWLGLAVALETDRRPADARAAYERAIALGGLRSDSADFARTRIYALR